MTPFKTSKVSEMKTLLDLRALFKKYPEIASTIKSLNTTIPKLN